MEEVFKDPVQLSKGINMKDLMTSQAEFTLDMDWTKYGVMIPDVEDEEDSDEEDIFRNVEERVEEMLLSSPEYLSFEELASKMVDVPFNPPGAVKITVLEEGDGPLVPADAEVAIHYAAYWEKEKVPFDSSLTANGGNPMRIRLGAGRCLPGIEAALLHARGPTARLLALLGPPAAWGPHGAPPRIRPEPALFVVALTSVGESVPRLAFDSLPIEEQTKYSCTVKTVTLLRREAKSFFNRHRYRRAIETYQRATHVLSLSRPETEQDRRELKNMQIKLFVNLAVCYYKLNKPHLVIDMCENIDRIIHIETHCKALFYYGKAYEMLDNYELAVKYFKMALKLEPNNKEIGSLLADIDERIRKANADEAKMWRKAFNTEDKKETYKVDEDFETQVREMCQDLLSRQEYTKVDLPPLSTDEVACLRAVVGLHPGLAVEGSRGRVAVIRTC